ncbi:MAG: hypothetical protein ACOC4B_00840 [Bacteroidota bacterium]
MKKKIVFYFLFVISPAIISQQIHLTYSKPFEVHKTSSVISAGAINEIGFVLQKEKKHNDNYSLISYEINNMKRISKQLIIDKRCEDTLNCIDNNYSFSKLLFLKEKMILLLEQYDSDENKNTLFAQHINMKGKFEGKLVIIDQLEGEREYKSGNSWIYVNEDKTKFMVLGNKDYEGDEKIFKIKTYDENLNNLTNSTINLPNLDYNVRLINALLDNQGKVILLTKNFLPDEEVKIDQDNHYYSILHFNPDNNEMDKYNIQLNKKNIHTTKLAIDNDKQLISCAGLYATIKKKRKKARDRDGFFYMKINTESQEIIQEITKDFSEKTISKITGKKLKRVKKKESFGLDRYFYMDHIIHHDNGSITLIGENRYLDSRTSGGIGNSGMSSTGVSKGISTGASGGAGNYGMSSTAYYNVNKDILLIGLDKEGKLKYVNNIPRHSYFRAYTKVKPKKYLVLEKEEKIYILYNQETNNMDPYPETTKDINIKLTRPKKAYLLAAEVSPDGSYKRIKLHNSKEKKSFISTEKMFKLNKTDYLIPTISNPSLGCGCFTGIFRTKRTRNFLKVKIE